ncbi:uncharacterized protein LOC134009593 [Osmerus eperlanus]|uniref:uncharacterized protein LOC134009593 n=1 Tax=Osmerus eperlanus TaxID=29151 RepID=UPI002E122EE9
MFQLTMQVARLVIFVLFNCLALVCTTIPPVHRFGIVKEPVTLTAKYERNCVVKYKRTLTGLQGVNIEKSVVEKGKPTQSFKDKIKIIDTKIIFSEAEYNNRGVYELFCDANNNPVEEIRLEILNPGIAYAEEEGDVSYPFYADTNGLTDIQVHLRKLVNGSLENLGQLRTTAGNAGTYLKGFQGNASLTDDGHDGHFLVNFTNINHSNQGTYVIIITEKNLTVVNSEISFQVKGKTSECPTHLASTVLIIILILIVIGCVIVIVCLCARNGCISEDQILAVQDAPLSSPIPVQSNPEVRYEQVLDQHDAPIKNGSQGGENSSSVKPIDRQSIPMPHIQGSTFSASE